MIEGKWAQPRHSDVLTFEKDYPIMDLSGLDILCPGCRKPVKLSRKSPNGRIAGWCKQCQRDITL